MGGLTPNWSFDAPHALERPLRDRAVGADQVGDDTKGES